MPQPAMAAIADLEDSERGCDVFRYHVTSTEVITKYDFVRNGGTGYAYQMSAASQSSKFAGIALVDSEAEETDDIAVCHRCIVDVDCRAASYTVSDPLRLSSSNYLEPDGGANTIAWAAENSSGKTRLKVLINGFKLGGTDTTNFKTNV